MPGLLAGIECRVSVQRDAHLVFLVTSEAAETAAEVALRVETLWRLKRRGGRRDISNTQQHEMAHGTAGGIVRHQHPAFVEAGELQRMDEPFLRLRGTRIHILDAQ